MNLIDLVPECKMQKFFFDTQGDKYDALRYFEDIGVWTIYRDDKKWIAINKNDPNYDKAYRRAVEMWKDK